MKYVPTFRLFFPAGVYNDYRIRDGRVEFSSNQGQWRVLNNSDVQLHFRFKTPVSKWLRENYLHLQPSGTNAPSETNDKERKARGKGSRILSAER
jgi:hypothetical protein